MELLTVTETARLLRVNPMTVRRHISAGRLPAVRVGRGVRVRRDALEAFLQPAAPHSRSDASINPDMPGRPLTEDDPLWELVGAAVDAPPSDASRKHEYLAAQRDPDRAA